MGSESIAHEAEGLINGLLTQRALGRVKFSFQ